MTERRARTTATIDCQKRRRHRQRRRQQQRHTMIKYSSTLLCCCWLTLLLLLQQDSHNLVQGFSSNTITRRRVIAPQRITSEGPSTAILIDTDNNRRRRRILSRSGRSRNDSREFLLVLFSESLSFEEDFSSWSEADDNDAYMSAASRNRKSLKLVQDRMKIALRPLQEKKRRRKKNAKSLSVATLKQQRQAAYEQQIENKGSGFWSFEGLFPEPVYDLSQVKEDLYGIAERDTKLQSKLLQCDEIDSDDLISGGKVPTAKEFAAAAAFQSTTAEAAKTKSNNPSTMVKRIWEGNDIAAIEGTAAISSASASAVSNEAEKTSLISGGKVNQEMTERVEGALYGIRKTLKFNGEDYEYYDNSDEGGVQFRDGVRLGSALKINTDMLTYHARRELRYNHIEESQYLYEKALEMDPRDGRAYLGLSRIAQRCKDYRLARKWLLDGIQQSVSIHPTTGQPDWGGNPYLLQALGCLEERLGYLTKAEQYLVKAIRSRPSHAPAYVALVQLRTRKFRQTAQAGGRLFEKCEEELQKAGMKPNAHVYTAWAALEYKKAGEIKRARQLFKKAIDIDPRCSSAWLQWGVMEANSAPASSFASGDDENNGNNMKTNYEQAEKCYKSALQYDPRNSRVLQAYAILETKRGNTKNAVNLFERALKAKPRDAGVLQAYALFVSDLGDYESARALLEKGTRVNKRHAPLWQAWGVLELRRQNYDEAREIFQQGIWSCAQPSGTQSGGHACARLWQAWGVLECRTGDVAAARQCFHRALDADPWNVATFTAWPILEELQGQPEDARVIYERALKQFPAGSDEKSSLWRAYELMEQRLGNMNKSQLVYQRSMRETMQNDNNISRYRTTSLGKTNTKTIKTDKKKTKKREDVEVWVGSDSSSMKGEVWVMDDGAIESKVPKSVMKNKKKTKR